VFVRLGKILVVFALVTTLGVHWALLQTVAWTAMLAENFRTHSMEEAVTQTFDGKHLCPLCRAIAAGKKSEKKSEFNLQTQKLEFPPTRNGLVVIAPSRFEIMSESSLFAESLPQKPPTPPPRGIHV